MKQGTTPRPLRGQEAFSSPFRGKPNTTPSGGGFFIDGLELEIGKSLRKKKKIIKYCVPGIHGIQKRGENLKG
jgi:hypothetical protein